MDEQPWIYLTPKQRQQAQYERNQFMSRITAMIDIRVAESDRKAMLAARGGK